MKSGEQREQDKRRWQAKSEDMYDELYEWRQQCRFRLKFDPRVLEGLDFAGGACS